MAVSKSQEVFRNKIFVNLEALRQNSTLISGDILKIIKTKYFYSSWYFSKTTVYIQSWKQTQTRSLSWQFAQKESGVGFKKHEGGENTKWIIIVITAFANNLF